MPSVETSTPPKTPAPIGPYSHIAKVDRFITIGGTAGVDPATGRLAGSHVRSQAGQILDSFKMMLEAVGSDLEHVVHVNIFLKQTSDFKAMNGPCVKKMGDYRPARIDIGVSERDWGSQDRIGGCRARRRSWTGLGSSFRKPVG